MVAHEQIHAKLNICRACPGGHAVWRDGDVYTCGPMFEGLRRSGQAPCGCVLRLKASDSAENCPFDWWPTDG